MCNPIKLITSVLTTFIFIAIIYCYFNWAQVAPILEKLLASTREAAQNLYHGIRE